MDLYRTRHFRIFLVLFALWIGCSSPPARANEDDIWGTYRLVSGTYHYFDNNETVDAYGAHPNGYLTYGADGRMMVVVAFDGRPTLEQSGSATLEQRAGLFNTMFAYAGTYNYSDGQMTHHILVSWNESWTGRDLVHDVTREQNKMTFVTKPIINPRNGRQAVVTLVWEKI